MCKCHGYVALKLLNDEDAHDPHTDCDGHADDDGDATQNCRASEYVEKWTHIAMKMMIMMNVEIAGYPNVYHGLEIWTSRGRLKPPWCQNILSGSQIL